MKSILSNFFWRDSICRLYREKGKFLLSTVLSFILISCIAGYLGNLHASNDALQQASETFPVKLQVYSKNGRHNQNLQIAPLVYQGLLDLGVSDAHFTASGRAVDVHSTATPSTGAAVCAVNSVSTLAENGGTIDFVSGYDASCIEESFGVCLITEEWSEANGISPGDHIFYHIYVPRYDSKGQTVQYEDVGICELTAVGTVSFSAEGLGEIIVPIQWLWEQERSVGIQNVCNSFQAVVTNPMELNTFKSKLPSCGLGRVDQNAKDSYKGTAVIIEDKKYIEYAEQMMNSISLLKQYLIPFFLLVFLMVTVLSFLIFRSDRKDMAIAISLGRPVSICSLSYFVSLLVSDLIGAVVALLPVWLLIRNRLLMIEIYLSFFLCVSIGVGLCTFFMSRSNVWKLLTQRD